MVEAKITRLTSGNTAIRPDRWSSTSGWAGSGKVPKRFLGNFEGLLQSDGYGAYDHVGGPKLVHAACWAHYLESVFIWNEGRGSRLGPLELAAVVSR